jgi:hypothetical protein
MASSKINLISEKAYQLSGSTLNLSGVTQIHNGGRLIVPTPINNNDASNKQYVDTSSGVPLNNTIFLSPTYGNNSNDGLNPKRPVKDLSVAIGIINDLSVQPSINNIWTIHCDGYENIDISGVTEIPIYTKLFLPKSIILDVETENNIIDLCGDIVCDTIYYNTAWRFNVPSNSNVNINVNKIINDGGYDPILSISNNSIVSIKTDDVIINDINDVAFIYCTSNSSINVEINKYSNLSNNKTNTLLEINSGNTVTLNVSDVYSNECTANGFTLLKVNDDNNKATVNFEQLKYTGTTGNTSILKIFSGCTDNNISIIGKYSELNYNNIMFGYDISLNVFNIYNFSNDNNVTIFINQYDGKRYYYPSENVDDDQIDSLDIYLSTNGSDDNGDGTQLNPYATINKAINSIKNHFIGYPSINIYFSSGTYDVEQIDLDEISNLYGEGEITFNGNKVLVNSGFTAYSSVINDPLTYNVSGGTSGSWTTNQYKFYFIGMDGFYYPITNNTNSTISTVSEEINLLFTGIYTNDVMFNFNGFNLGINIGIELYFNNIDIHFTNGGIIPQYLSRYFNCHFQFCKISSNNAYENDIYKFGVYRSIVNNVRYDGVDILDTYFYNSVVNPNINLSIGSNVFEDTSIILDHGINISSHGYLKFINTIDCIIHSFNNMISFINNDGGGIISDGSTNLFNCTPQYTGSTTPININIDDNFFITTPTNYFGYPLTELCNPNHNRNIYIKNVTYPEFEYNLVNTLNNSGTTNIVIGNTTQNKSISVDYTITRGNGLRTGSFDILYNSGNVYIGTDEFITNGETNVDVTNIVFDVNLNGNEIRMESTLSNDVDATIEYNLKRKLVKPINI